MKTLNLIKKVVAIGLISVMGLGVLSGCTTTGPTQDEITEQINAAAQSAMASVDITADNQAVINAATQAVSAENARLQAVLEDAKAAQAEIAAELAVAQSTGVVDENGEVVDIEEVSLSGYVIDDIALDADFEETLDNDDYAELYYQDVEYDGEDYVAEEKLYISSDVKPVLNIEDFDGEVAVEIVDDDAIIYKVEFDEAIQLESDDEDEVLAIDFLGQPLKIISYDNDTSEIEYRLSERFVKSVGDEFTVDGKVVKIVAVGEDGDEAYISVDGVSDSVDEGETEKINGIEVYVEDVFASDSYNAVKIYVGDEVSETVQDGDEYEADDRYNWVIEGDSDGITALGVTLDRTFEDDDEVLIEGAMVTLPEEYMAVEFAGVKYMDVLDLTLDLSRTKMEVEFTGTIEVDGDKVDDGKLTILDDLSYEYDYKDDTEESSDFTDIKIIHDDRELSLSINATSILIYDADVTYQFVYEFGDDSEFSESLQNATKMNEDDNYRLVNGDLLYSSQVNEASDEEDTVVIGLVSDESVECLLRVRK